MANPLTILVVEDESLIRMAAVAILEDAGYWVLEAQNSAEALDVLARHAEISILLTDVRMDGLALVTWVQLNNPAIRSIVVSGNASAAEASKAGASIFVKKPYLPTTIVKAVHETVLRH
ncbi:MAG: response regulator [Alphaproteobacteria bacterium]|nr:response regulator [Alphaproteobacteria bacterium]